MKFKVGDRVRVVRFRSTASKAFHNQTGIITKIFHPEQYVRLDIEENAGHGGLWFSEITPFYPKNFPLEIEGTNV